MADDSSQWMRLLRDLFGDRADEALVELERMGIDPSHLAASSGVEATPGNDGPPPRPIARAHGPGRGRRRQLDARPRRRPGRRRAGRRPDRLRGRRRGASAGRHGGGAVARRRDRLRSVDAATFRVEPRRMDRGDAPDMAGARRAPSRCPSLARSRTCSRARATASEPGLARQHQPDGVRHARRPGRGRDGEGGVRRDRPRASPAAGAARRARPAFDRGVLRGSRRPRRRGARVPRPARVRARPPLQARAVAPRPAAFRDRTVRGRRDDRSRGARRGRAASAGWAIRRSSRRR